MFDLALYYACITGDVEVSMVRAIIEAESDGRKNAFNVNNWSGKRFEFKSVGDAVIACKVFTQNDYTVDVGLMAINSKNLSRFELSMEEGFDVCTNIKYGTRIFHENLSRALEWGYEGAQAKKIALSLYNTGSPIRGMENGYVDNVWAVYKRLLKKTKAMSNGS